MTINAAIVVFAILAGLVLVQAAVTRSFLKALKGPGPEGSFRKDFPRAAVLLCLRGDDPRLSACLESLLHQDYPRYRAHIVVDHPRDPAAELVREAMREAGAEKLRVSCLQDPLSSCSLKCSALSQAAQRLDDSCQVVALLDGDVVPHRTWLKELVASLADESAGISCGNRWYVPRKATWGSLVRHLWNAAAVVQMHGFGIPWGGSLAFRTSLLRDAPLLQRWSRTLSDDVVLYELVRSQGMKVKFSPSSMMVDDEVCTIGTFFHWGVRQLLMTRLYHPSWPLVVAHGASTTLALGAGILALAVAACAGNGLAALWCGSGLALHELAMILLLLPMELEVRRKARERGEEISRPMPATMIKTLLALPLTQLLYPAMLVRVFFLRTVEWRGIRYRVDGPWRIRMKGYRPFRPGPKR